MNTYTTMNIDVAKGQVLSLRQTAHDLHVLATWMLGIKDATGNITDETQRARIAGYTFAVVILRALATELMLKPLSFKMTGTYEGGHNLKKLFDKLDDGTKKIITKIETSHGVVGLVEKALEGHKDDFVEWRYPMEGNDLSTHFPDISRALNILLEAYNDEEFVKLCTTGSELAPISTGPPGIALEA